MNKMQKLTCARVLKVIFYLLGFPLLLLLTAKDSMIFFDVTVFERTAKTGIAVIFVMWLAFTLIQLGLYLVMKKQQALRTVILVILAVVLMLAPVAVLDKNAEKQLNDIEAKYESQGVGVEAYNLQKQWFVSLSATGSRSGSLINKIEDFVRVYNLKGFNPKTYRSLTQLNVKPYYVTRDGKRYESKDIGFGELIDQGLNPVAYNPNGMLYDGYIFGVETAVDLLIEYNEFKQLSITRPAGTLGTEVTEEDALANKYKIKIETTKEDGTVSVTYATYNPEKHTTGNDPSKIRFDGKFYEFLNADQALAKAVTTAEDSEAWLAYTSTDDYKAKKAEADKYVLTEERLNEVLLTLFEYIGKSPGLNDLIKGINADGLIAMLGNLGINIGGTELGAILGGLRNPAKFLLGDLITISDPENAAAYEAYKTEILLKDYPAVEALTDLLKGLQPILPMLGGLLSGTIVDAIKGLLPIDLSIVGLTDAKLTVIATDLLNKVLDPATGIDLGALTSDNVLALLMSIVSEISFYQHPELKMVWDGQFMTDADKELGLDRYAWVKYHCEKFGITSGCVLATSSGLLTGKSLGNDTPSDKAYGLGSLYQLKADLEYKPALYPKLAARRYMAMWAGVLAMSIFLTAYCFSKEQKLLYELTTTGGEY